MWSNIFWIAELFSVLGALLIVLSERRRKGEIIEDIGFSRVQIAVVALMTFFNPLLVPLIIFYGLKDIAPSKARAARLLGFILFIPGMTVFLLL